MIQTILIEMTSTFERKYYFIYVQHLNVNKIIIVLTTKY